MMIRKFSLVMLALILSIGFVAPILADADVAGKKITRTNTEGQKYTTEYYENGTTFTSSTRRDGSCCETSPGRWWMENGMVCETYANWRNGATWCH